MTTGYECARCGRRGTHDFTADGEACRCATTAACERRQKRAEHRRVLDAIAAENRQSQLEALEGWHQRALSLGMTEAEWTEQLEQVRREHPTWPASSHGFLTCPLDDQQRERLRVLLDLSGGAAL